MRLFQSGDDIIWEAGDRRFTFKRGYLKVQVEQVRADLGAAGEDMSEVDRYADRLLEDR